MAESNPTRYELRILGAPDLRGPDGRRVGSVLSQPARLGLLAYLALAPGPVARATVVADFWPENDEPRARNALSQALFYLRRSLGKDAVQNVEGDRLRVPPEVLWCDARELLGEERPSAEVVEAASDELLAGWNAESSQPLQEWLDRTRRQVKERGEQLRRARESEREQEASTAGAERRPRRSDDHRPRASPEDTGVAAAAPSSSAWTPRDLRLRTTAALLISVVALLLVAGVALRGRTAEAEPTADRPARLAVLLPRVRSTAQGAPDIDELALNAELLVDMPSGNELDVLSLPTANSLQDLMSQRARIGATADMPDWVLDVGVDVTRGAAHVQWVLYRGEDRAVYGADSFDEPLTGSAIAVVDLTRAIAAEVATAVGELVH
ncbi:MAG: hypothetical protein PVJ80_13820 [Gemmatimonadota bacterium]|jgi:hypothetical protein